MGGNSLARRLFVLSAIWGAVSLAVAGFILITVYRGSVERAFDERLSVYLKTLVGALAAQGDGGDTFRVPDNLGEARFELPLSGWYWVVRRSGDDKTLIASPSLTGEVLRLPDDSAVRAGSDRVVRTYLDGPDGQHLRLIERLVDFDGSQSFRVAVAGNAGDLEADIAVFRWRTIMILAVVGFGTALSALLQVRLALAPLERMRNALFRIRSGDEDRLAGDVPTEMAPFAQELNALIDANREAMERARTHVGNLAHALKTPLSVLLNEARDVDDPLARHVVEQATLMREHVQHHLDRARIAAQRRVIGVVTDVEPVVERLVRAMRKIHADKGVTIAVDLDPGLRFRGEREDLEEALGNLIDNACKWCRHEVTVTVRLDLDRPDDQGRRMVMCVEDDGAGLTPEARAEGPRRGRRLDEKVPGTGLGLAIVGETAALYGGSFTLGESSLGGLRCELSLPAL